MEEKKKDKKQLIKIIGGIIGIVIVAFLVKDVIKSWAQILPYLQAMNVPLFCVSILIYAAAFLFTGYNWCYLLWKMEKGPGRKTYLDIHMVSALARYIPGGIWSIVGKSILCNRKGVGKKAITVSIILEYVFQIVSSGLFFLVLLPFIFAGSTAEDWIWMAVAVCSVLIVIIILPHIINLGIQLLSKFMKKDCGEIRLEKRFVYGVLIRYLAAWCVTGIGLVVLVMAFEKIDVLQGLLVALSYPVSWVVGFLSPSPNGMGIREAIFRMLLNGKQAAELVLLIVVTSRIWTIIGELVAFAGFKIYYLVTEKKKNA